MKVVEERLIRQRGDVVESSGWVSDSGEYHAVMVYDRGAAERVAPFPLDETKPVVYCVRQLSGQRYVVKPSQYVAEGA